ESWPGLNGTLDIRSDYGQHIYNYSQNPNNGTQKTTLVYEESSGLLLSFSSEFEGYSLSTSLTMIYQFPFVLILENGEFSQKQGENENPNNGTDTDSNPNQNAPDSYPASPSSLGIPGYSMLYFAPFTLLGLGMIVVIFRKNK
ncbi:MAG: hypothetical protein ACTSWC_05530, partial [Promethearchaeota archaeon]